MLGAILLSTFGFLGTGSLVSLYAVFVSFTFVTSSRFEMFWNDHFSCCIFVVCCLSTFVVVGVSIFCGAIIVTVDGWLFAFFLWHWSLKKWDGLYIQVTNIVLVIKNEIYCFFNWLIFVWIIIRYTKGMDNIKGNRPCQLKNTWHQANICAVSLSGKLHQWNAIVGEWVGSPWGSRWWV